MNWVVHITEYNNWGLETFEKAYKLPGGCGGMTYPDQFH